MIDTIGVVEFTVFLVIIVVLISLFYVSLEKKKKREIERKFKKSAEDHQLSKQDMRTVPRIYIPDSMKIILTLTDDEYFGLKARALDISLSGFAVKPDFPLKKLPLNIIVNNVLVITPINTFVIREIRTVRITHQVDKRLMAYQVEKIDSDQLENLKAFIAYLDKFLKDEEETDKKI